MKVLIIPEDPTHDQYILKPIVERIFEDLGRKARIDVLRDPYLRGIDQALDQETLTGILDDNRMVDLFLLIIDRDCDRIGNIGKAREREQAHPRKVLACLAVEEVETWLLALFTEDLGESWSEVREECDPKERFFDPLVRQKDWSGEVGQGRKKGMRRLAGQWKRFKSLCPEVEDLSRRLENLLS